ncbi:hypothetical protein DM02DRAFT_648526 [Periconia macrospinosa]|uniref:Survival Motor Neuron Gemin2-binding domain-containing protein n=1 Tax=Periconia macrospinosa TaxID=97972 RepID=A0A2V1EBG3_9PLEO|nr:hypothetical protein DM02DRAFT_648526 [Periconia macrospinosa]
MGPEINLGDGGAWDDSALIDSWDEAVKEYTKYHSIQRSGKRLEDVLDQEELEQLRQEQGDVLGVAETNSSDADRNIHADSEAADVPEKMTNNSKVTSVNPDHAKVPSPDPGQKPGPRMAERTTAQTSAFDSSMPQALLGSVADEHVKNLMMSWYYAGYYTGLYAAQKAADTSDRTTSK